MKCVILAGGMGTRISEESHLRPKPMIEIGGKPILWHIMKIYQAHGVNDFIICCGYKGYMIKEYFANYSLHGSDVTFDFEKNTTTIHSSKAEPWKVTLVETGESTMTGGRIKRVRKYLDNEEPFCLTYGDGVGDINIREAIKFHSQHKMMATVTATRPPGRFGQISLQGTCVKTFAEKPAGDGGYINGGFFIINPRAVDLLISGDSTVWEQEPMENLARDGQMHAILHDGFWQPMDTLRDKTYLEGLWQSGKAPWRIWE